MSDKDITVHDLKMVAEGKLYRFLLHLVKIFMNWVFED